MTKIDDGGPAFPEAFWPTPQSDAPDYRPGMSLRDWFAGQALAGLLAFEGTSPGNTTAHIAWAIADDMLAERAKNRGDQS